MLKKLILTETEKTFFFSGKDPITTERTYSSEYYQHERNMYLNGIKEDQEDGTIIYTAPESGCNKYENTARCISIVEDLEAIAYDQVYKCPICGEIISEYEYFKATEDAPEHWLCECGCISDEQPEQYSLYDCFNEDIYDVEYRVSSRDTDEINSVKIMIACGGPTIYIDTADSKVKLYWWSDYAEAYINRTVSNDIESVFNEYWQCL